MTDTELISAIRATVKEEIAISVKREVAIAVNEETKGLKEELKEINKRIFF